jgi:peptidoglycan-N-acetylglucosamine deacetylase
MHRKEENMLAITIDIEDWYHVPAITGSPFSRFKDVDEFFARWPGHYDFLSESTKNVLVLLEKMSITATFFIVADVAEHYPGLIGQIAAKGHEVACHGLHHACKIHPTTKRPLLSQDEFEERTYKAKIILEKASNQEIIGYRSPGAYIAGWMIDSLENLGFKYDSSICVNSFYNKTDSDLKGVNTRPYFPHKGGLKPGDKRNIVELPWPYFEYVIKFPTAGGPMLRLLGAKYIMSGIKQSLKRGDTLFYFHPIDITLERFPINNSWRRPFYWMSKGKIAQHRIESVLNCHDLREMGTCKAIVTNTLMRNIGK